MNKRDAQWFAVILTGVGALGGYVIGLSNTHPSEARQQQMLCFQTEGTDVEGYTPAHWLERQALSGMVHQTRTSLRCRGEVNGVLGEWEADQIWVARQ